MRFMKVFSSTKCNMTPSRVIEKILQKSCLECLVRVKCGINNKLKILLILLMRVIFNVMEKFTKIKYWENLNKRLLSKFPKNVLYLNPFFKANIRSFLDFLILSIYSEGESIKFLLNLKPTPNIFIDIGAHAGKYSLIMARLGCEKIYSIEAEKENYLALKQNILLNNFKSKIYPFHMAICGKNGIATLHLAENVTDGSHSIVANRGTGRMEKVKCTTLHSFIDKNVRKHSSTLSNNILIKIDVEGAEYQILKSSFDFFKINKPQLLIEIWDENRKRVFSLLKRIGYKYYTKLDKDNYFFAFE